MTTHSPSPEIRVSKFGGSSLASTAHVFAVAHRVAAVSSDGRPVVVVVSAQSDTTDKLLHQAGQYGDLSLPSAGREVDQLLATGENASAALLALSLQRIGVPAVSVTGSQAGIEAVGPAGAGLISRIDPRPVHSLLRDGHVVVVAGFQGVNRAGDVVTLGRGGSDTTAVALAAALGTAACEIFTDVDGVYSADPRLVPDAAVLPTIGAEVMAEMAFAGARVLHSRAVELAAMQDISLRVRSSFTRSAGSLVTRRGDTTMLETEKTVTAATADTDVARVLVLADQDIAGELLAELAVHGVPVDLVARSGPHEEVFRMGFAVRRTDLTRVRTALAGVVPDPQTQVKIDEDVAKVSLIGMGLLNRPEYAARMISALGAAGISIRWISTSQIRVSVIIGAHRMADALNIVHAEFDLAHGADIAGRVPA
jgi:aspartate kinase